MPKLILRRQEVWAGALLIAFGAIALVLGGDLERGTAQRMGPGYVPFGLGWLLIAFGAVNSLRGLLRQSDPIEPMRLRPLLGVIAGALLFAFLIERGGILLASAGAILGSTLADRHSRYVESAILGAIALAFSAIVFVYLLGLPMRLWF